MGTLAPQVMAGVIARRDGLGEPPGRRFRGLDAREGAELLTLAVAAYRAALKVRTRTDCAMDWAMTQDNLGTALSQHGRRSRGWQGADLQEMALEACRAAMEIRPRALIEAALQVFDPDHMRFNHPKARAVHDQI